MKILLVAKPWKGGLARYLQAALQEAFPTAYVEWIATRPQTWSEAIAYHRDPKAWFHARVEAINNADCAAVFFINHQKELVGLEAKARNVLYLIDDARLTSAQAALYGRIYLSDPGYLPDLNASLPFEKSASLLPFACDPWRHKPFPYAGPKGDVCFLGNYGPKRARYWLALFEADLSPRIVGNAFGKRQIFWQHPLAFRPAVPNEVMGGIYARYHVSLNIHAEVVRQGTNMRTFEAAAYGIPQVVEWREGIEAYFEPEKEMLFFHDPDEMTAQIRFLLANPDAAMRMAEAARQRVLAEHTYVQRVKSAFKDGLS